MSKTERIAKVSPATGLMVFQNAPDSTGFYYFDGTAWLWVATATGIDGWATTGNAGMSITDNFFWTTDSVALRFRQNNKWIGRWNSAANNYFTGDSSGINTTGTNNIGLVSNSVFIAHANFDYVINPDQLLAAGTYQLIIRNENGGQIFEQVIVK